MVYVFVALYPEAKPLIHRLSLKREQTGCGFEVFSRTSGDIRLVLTGVGTIAAATAVGSSLVYYQAGGGDFLVNIGSCAGRGSTGQTFLCYKLIDRISGHTFYPDMWHAHSFSETCVITEPETVKDGACMEQENIVHDMEAAAIYQAGAHFLGPHQMSFVKVVSDAGEGTRVLSSQLEESMETAAEGLVQYLQELVEIGRQQKAAEGRQIDQEELEVLCEQLHCSQTMRAAVEQCVTYWTLSGTRYQDVLEQFREQGKLPCRDRREGKKRFYELREKIL